MRRFVLMAGCLLATATASMAHRPAAPIDAADPATWPCGFSPVENDTPGRMKALFAAEGSDVYLTEAQMAKLKRPAPTNPDRSTHVQGDIKIYSSPASATRDGGGALAGRVVYVMAGHGWTPNASTWALQRSPALGMVEDMGTYDQATIFADLALGAGAIVVPLRAFHHQSAEVVVDNDDAAATFAGTWDESGSTAFYGTPGDVAYRFATAVDGAATATARFSATITKTDFYPVYAWARWGVDRINQEYIVGHSGGTTSRRINHRMVGAGWVYLGFYHFEAGGQAYVEINNARQPGDTGTVVIADAIRFGNGMGSIAGASGISGKPREEENGTYWATESVGVAPDAPLAGTNWVSAPRELSEYMNFTDAVPDPIIDSTRKRVYLSFHSNAGGGRGADGLFNSYGATPTVPNENTTPDSYLFAQLTGQYVNRDMTAETTASGNPYEFAWGRSGFGSNVFGSGNRPFDAYGEINNSFNGEMAMTIIEVAFHDNSSDTALMRDSRVRYAIARANLHALIDYFNQVDSGPMTFLPEAPSNVAVVSDVAANLSLSWTPPVDGGPWGRGGDAPAGYVVYTSANGRGFVEAATVASGATASLDVTALVPPGETRFFRVSATNAGGESFPSAVVGASRPAADRNPILVVSGFTRDDRTLNRLQTENFGSFERVVPLYHNSFDYVADAGRSVAAHGSRFDSCEASRVESGAVSLLNYATVIWLLGEESTVNETFSAAEQALVTAFLAGGGNLFASGAEIGWDLGRSSGPTAADRAFLANQLRVGFPSNAFDDGNSYNATGSGLFASVGAFSIASGSNAQGTYNVDTPDVLLPEGAGASTVANYVGGTGNSAAVAYDGSAGGGRRVVMGIPFEAISPSAKRDALMAAVLDFFGAPADVGDWMVVY